MQNQQNSEKQSGALEAIGCQELKDAMIAQIGLNPAEAKHSIVEAIFSFFSGNEYVEGNYANVLLLFHSHYSLYHRLEQLLKEKGGAQ